MIISIASGKGGTGKTTVAVNLALSLEGKLQLLDCDVEEPNVDIFLKPRIEKEIPFYLPRPVVDKSKCTYCGKCSEVCQYNAIAVVKETVLIFYELCHSCGACKIVCPEDAIFEENIRKGVIQEGRRENIEFVKGELKVSEAAPTPLVKEVKKRAKDDYICIIDASPGTSCPVVEAVKDSHFCLLVTEPTPFGLNDLKLAHQVCKKLKVPSGVLINRANVGDKKVSKYCQRENIPLLMEIPIDREIAEKYSEGKPFVLEKVEYRQKFQNLLEKIKEII